MRISIGFLFITSVLLSCGAPGGNNEPTTQTLPITGTWQLLRGTVINNGDTTITDYTKNLSFIKIINNTHFAFLQHDRNKGKDSTASFVAGGGSYSLRDSSYTEHLQYCSDRDWEGNDFMFTVAINNDTLIQYGIEKVQTAGVNRLNIEQYVRLKK